MAGQIADTRPVTAPAQVPKQQSSAPVADKPPRFPLSRVEIGRSTARTATGRNRVDEVVVAAAAEEIAAGIAATDLLSVDVIRSRVRCGARNRRTCVCLLIRPNSVIASEARSAEPRAPLFYLPFGTQSGCPILAAALSRQGWDALPNTSHGTPASHREARVEERSSSSAPRSPTSGAFRRPWAGRPARRRCRSEGRSLGQHKADCRC